MIAILLAAGVGRRLGHDKPKALIDVGGRSLIARHCDVLAALDIPLRVVTGFEAPMLEAELEGAETVHNPAFRRGSLLSLSAALEGLDDDAIFMDADVLYDPSILADIAGLERGFALDPRTDPGDEEMMIGVRDGTVRAIRRGKLPGYDVVGEGVGFFKIDAPALPALREAVAASDPDGDYEAALDRFVGEHGAQYVLVDGRPWIEIDFPEDVDAARREILPLLEQA